MSSGAIGVGMGKAGLSVRPTETKKKQALAAIGQCELMFMYDKLFGEYNHSVAQILLTRYAVETEQKRQNVINTLDELLDMNIIPVINENDTVAIDELEGNNFGDNDMLSAIVAGLVGADKLVILTDIDVCTTIIHAPIQTLTKLMLWAEFLPKFLKWRQAQAQTEVRAE